MAMSVVYGNFAGEVVYESREGEERWYVPDTLGSTQALVDMEGNVTDAYDYWSYGEEREHVGDSPTDLTFLGVLGYVKDTLNRLYYVRARHLRPELARWQTVDPLWPSQKPYKYVDGAPATYVDPSGLNKLCDFYNCYKSRVADDEKHRRGDTRREQCIYCKSLVGAHVDCDSEDFNGPYPSNNRQIPDWVQALIGGIWADFKYGRYCGLYQVGPGEPIDLLDEACRKHDRCLATYADFFTKQLPCNRALCADAIRATKRCRDPKCVNAGTAIIFAYCPFGLI